MLIEPGMKLLVAHRRLFETDHLRYFTGSVDGYQDGIARVTGHSWLRNGYTGTFCRKTKAATKLIALASGTVLVYHLPSSVHLDGLVIVANDQEIFLRDDRDFEMDLTEALPRPSSRDAVR